MDQTANECLWLAACLSASQPASPPTLCLSACLAASMPARLPSRSYAHSVLIIYAQRELAQRPYVQYRQNNVLLRTQASQKNSASTVQLRPAYLSACCACAACLTRGLSALLICQLVCLLICHARHVVTLCLCELLAC